MKKGFSSKIPTHFYCSLMRRETLNIEREGVAHCLRKKALEKGKRRSCSLSWKGKPKGKESEVAAYLGKENSGERKETKYLYGKGNLVMLAGEAG